MFKFEMYLFTEPNLCTFQSLTPKDLNTEGRKNKVRGLNSNRSQSFNSNCCFSSGAAIRAVDDKTSQKVQKNYFPLRAVLFIFSCWFGVGANGSGRKDESERVLTETDADQETEY